MDRRTAAELRRNEAKREREKAELLAHRLRRDTRVIGFRTDDDRAWAERINAKFPFINVSE